MAKKELESILEFEEDKKLKDLNREEMDQLLVRAVQNRLARDDEWGLRKNLFETVAQSRIDQTELDRIKAQYFETLHGGEITNPNKPSSE